LSDGYTLKAWFLVKHRENFVIIIIIIIIITTTIIVIVVIVIIIIIIIIISLSPRAVIAQSV
jgi:hypothetical protein